MSHLICMQLGYFIAKDTAPRHITSGVVGEGWLKAGKVVVGGREGVTVINVAWIDRMTEVSALLLSRSGGGGSSAGGGGGGGGGISDFKFDKSFLLLLFPVFCLTFN